MSDDGKVGFAARASGALRATGRFLRARKQASRLRRQCVACESELSKAYGDLGAAAQQAQIGKDLPAYEETQRCRDEGDRAQAHWVLCQGALTSAQDELSKQTVLHDSAIAAAQGEHTSASSAALTAAGELTSARNRLAELEAEIGKTQSGLASLKSAGDSTEPTEQIGARLSSLRQQRTGLETVLNSAKEAQRQSSAIVGAKADELKKAAMEWQALESKCRKELTAAQAMTTPEKAVAVQAAQAKLDEETQRNTQLLTGLETRHKTAAQVAEADAAKTEVVRGDLAAVDAKIQAAERVLAARRLQADLARLGADRAAAGEKAATMQAHADAARVEAQAKASSLRAAQEAWQQAKARCDAAVSSAASALGQAQQSILSVQAQLAKALCQFGRQVLEGGLGAKSGGLEEPSARAATHLEELASIHAALSGARAEMDATRGTALKTAILAGGVLVVLIAMAITVFLLVKSPSRSPSPSGPGSGAATDSARGGGGGLVLRSAMSDAEKEKLCRERLERLAVAIQAHRMVHDGIGPAKLSDLYYSGLVQNLSDFQCPASDAPAISRTRIDPGSDFTVEPLAGAADVVVREKTPRHGTGTVLAATVDGVVRAVPIATGSAAHPSP